MVVGGFESHPTPNANRDLKRTEAIVMGFIASSTDGAAVVERDTCYITFQSSICTRLHKRPEVLLGIIRKLRGFKTIIVTAIASDFDKDIEAQEAIIRARTKPAYEMALKKLANLRSRYLA